MRMEQLLLTPNLSQRKSHTLNGLCRIFHAPRLEENHQSVLPQCSSLTFLCKLLVYDELPVSEVVQYWTKIGGVSIDEIRPCLVLLKRGWVSGTRKRIISVENNK